MLRAADHLVAAGETDRVRELEGDIQECRESSRKRLLLATLGMWEGSRERAMSELEQAWSLRQSGDDPAVAARIAAALAAGSLHAGRPDEVAEWAGRGLEASRGNDRACLGFLALASGLRGDPEDGLSLLAGVGEGSPQRPDGGLERGLLAMWAGDAELAESALRAAHQDASSQGPFHVGVLALAHLADVEYRLGRWDEAIGHGAQCASLAADVDPSWLGGITNAVASFPLAGRGVWDAATGHVDQAEEAAREVDLAADLVWAATARARLAHARGDPRAVLEALEPLRDVPGAVAFSAPRIQPWRVLRTEALVKTGSLAEAEADWNLLGDVPTPEHQLRFLAGLLAAARRRVGEAETDFLIALESAEGSPFEQGLVGAAYGALLRRLGRRREAATRLRAAREVFSALQAAPYMERCERELAACGLTPAKRHRRDRTHLTPQELVVARLVAAGMTNRQVAEELVVSPKTVEYHLANVYAKVGVVNRTQLAARWQDRKD